MLGKAIAGALIIGPFSGVSVNNITDTPMLVQEALFEAQSQGGSTRARKLREADAALNKLRAASLDRRPIPEALLLPAHVVPR